MIGYSERDWAGDVHNRKSTSGMLITLYDGVMLWKTSKKCCITRSSSESEYMVLVELVQMVKY